MARRMTLKEQWDCLRSQEAMIKQSHINEFVSEKGMPKLVYHVTRIGDIETAEVKDFSVIYMKDDVLRLLPPFLDEGKRPSKKMVDEMKEYVDKILLAERKIYVNYSISTGNYKSASSMNYADVVAEKGWSFNPIDLEVKACINKDLYAPREGFKPCRYCGKQTPVGEMVESTIIGRGRKNVWNGRKGCYESKACITEEKLKFCSGKCAGNEQMSREG